ncbi:hypothetical protein MNR01_10680 [Lysobacter sp. S4-A87]|uniref:hypothetical protein n=1 Tax=Lysobacter sp. S4-A87 TaxID=2925843 RepID=UPI001F530222|nr:hypothetical protein [Lysobacter sp. S4-A87]UNK48239.1 hypothetical protein MNR01_10680 [Lysobacter sp. S4-A87]
MNTRLFVLLLAVVAPVAAAQSATDPMSPTITIDCQRPLLPSQQDIARLTGVDNLGQAYAVRTRLMIDTQRACQRNAGIVQLVLANPQAPRRLAGR